MMRLWLVIVFGMERTAGCCHDNGILLETDKDSVLSEALREVSSDSELSVLEDDSTVGIVVII